MAERFSDLPGWSFNLSYYVPNVSSEDVKRLQARASKTPVVADPLEVVPSLGLDAFLVDGDGELSLATCRSDLRRPVPEAVKRRARFVRHCAMSAGYGI